MSDRGRTSEVAGGDKKAESSPSGPSPSAAAGAGGRVTGHKTLPSKGLGISLGIPVDHAAKHAGLRRINSGSSVGPLGLSAALLTQANQSRAEDPEAQAVQQQLDLRSRLKENDKLCSQIWDYLFLGSETVSANYELLKQNGVTHILNCASLICKVYHPDKFEYRCLWLLDGREEDISCLLYDVIDWIETARKVGGRVFIHCQQGVSRSSAMAIGYLMWLTKQGFAETHSMVKSKRNVSNPNAGFVTQLMTWHKRRDILPDPKGPPRVYEVIPHSVGDPTYVPKAVRQPLTGACLRSSSCFIVETHDAFYIWKGADAIAPCVEAARVLVTRFQTYEARVLFPCILRADASLPQTAPSVVAELQEGAETAPFWVALGGAVPAAGRVAPVYVHPPLPFSAEQARDFTASRGGVADSAPEAEPTVPLTPTYGVRRSSGSPPASPSAPLSLAAPPSGPNGTKKEKEKKEKKEKKGSAKKLEKKTSKKGKKKKDKKQKDGGSDGGS